MLTTRRVYHQTTSFLEIAIYLFILFGIFALHEALVSAKNGISYRFYSFAIANALILRRVMLVADDLNFADWFRERPLIYAISTKAAAFAVLLVIFDIVEEVVVGKGDW